jgi:hypothetical protein
MLPREVPVVGPVILQVVTKQAAFRISSRSLSHRTFRTWFELPGARAGFGIVVLFLLNGYIALSLFKVEFYRHMSSVEGLFIAITRYVMEHPHDLTWLPLWYLGMPFHHVYPPGIHVSAAWLGLLTGWSPAHAWHFTVALLYCFGPPLLFWMAWKLSGRLFTSFAAGLLWTVLSPSCLLVPSIWHDTGEMISNRRLHNTVGWGEGPNAVTLGLAMLAIGLLHLAVTRGKPVHYVGAVIATAVVPLCSWPAFAAMLMGIGCYVLSRELGEWKHIISRLSLIGAFAYALVAVWLPPSTILATYLRSRQMMGTPPPGFGRALAALGLCLLLALLWMLFRRFQPPFWFRFAAFYLAITAWISLADFYGGPQLAPQAGRFHLAMEIPFILTLSFGVNLLTEGWRRTQYTVIAILLAFAIRQTPVARRYARSDMASEKIESTFEYQMAAWLDQHMHGERVFALGSTSFWMNVFTDTPQLGGCCDQANTNWMNDVAGYTIGSGDGTGDKDAEIRSLWMKAFGVHAIALGGPHTRDAYHGFGRPESLIRALPVLRRDGDDYILDVPSRSATLGHVMRHSDLSPRLPVNGLDTGPIQQYVDAIENPAYPLLDERWPNQHTAIARAMLEKDDILSFQITYWPGWRATANGRPAAVKRDTLGLMYVEPNCAGQCSVQMTWDGGIEALLLRWLQWAGVLIGVVGLGWSSRGIVK